MNRQGINKLPQVVKIYNEISDTHTTLTLNNLQLSMGNTKSAALHHFEELRYEKIK